MAFAAELQPTGLVQDCRAFLSFWICMQLTNGTCRPSVRPFAFGNITFGCVEKLRCMYICLFKLGAAG
jgi:hypothetical protein